MSPERRARPVAILAPTGRDANVTAKLLQDSGFEAQPYSDMTALCHGLGDSTGAIVLAEEALNNGARAEFTATLTRQPAWSDIPVIVLTGEGELSGAPSPIHEDLAGRVNLTLLERPVRRATFITTLRSALRARSRQHEVRDYLLERRVHEDRLSEARQLAEVANDAKMRFLATMSHELRTPLNAIAGYTELMLMELHGPVTAQQRADLERIERSQRYLLSLINDILNFAKIESGQVAFTLKPFPIDHVLRELDSFIAPQIAVKDVSYTVEVKDPECMVCADEEKTQQILLNLLSNACKFTPRGGTIAVVCTMEDGHVCVTITDSGPGIPPEKLETVFEPFVQLDRGLTKTMQGTGLGLSISRDLARRMGGDLTASAAPGGGARFTLTLPRA